LSSGAVFDNYGTLDLQNYTLIGNLDVADGGAFQNYGAVLKTSGDPKSAVSSFVVTTVNNAGLIDVGVGTLQLGNAFNSGTITAATGTVLDFGRYGMTSTGSIQADTVIAGGTIAGSYQANHTSVTNAVFTGTIVNLGDLNVQTSLDISAATLAPGANVLTSLILDGGFGYNVAQLIASQDLIVTGLFTFEHNCMLRGVGGHGSLTAQGGTDFALDGGFFGQVISGFHFINPAGQTATFHGNIGSGGMGLGASAVFDNYGTLDLQGHTTLWDADPVGGTFNNYGTVVKSIAAPANYPDSIFAQNVVNNAGLFDIRAGELDLGGSQVTNTGTITAAVGTFLAFEDGVTSTGSIQGDTVLVNGGQVSGTFQANHTSAAGVFTGTIVSFGDLGIGGTLDISGATLLPGANVLGSVNLHGTLIANQDLTALGLTTWAQGGALVGVSGRGSLTAAGGTNILGGPPYAGQLFSGFHFINPAGQTVTWQANDAFIVQNNAVFDNYGTVNLQDNIGFQNINYSIIDGTFNNYGSLVMSGSAADDYFDAVALYNSGSIDVQAGTLWLGSGSYSSRITNTGIIHGATGTWVNVYGSLTSSGSIDVDQFGPTSGTENISGSFAANFTDIWQAQVTMTGAVANFGVLSLYRSALDLSNATLASAAKNLNGLYIYGSTLITGDDFRDQTQSINWIAAIFVGVGGHGSLTVSGGMSISVSSSVSAYDFSFINPATTTWTGGTVCFYGADSSFTNTATGTFDDQTDGTFGNCDGNCAPFNNQGLFVKSGGTGTTNLQMELFNTGTVTVQSGNLNLGCGYVQAPPSGSSGSSGTISGNITGTVSNPGQLTVAPSPSPPPTLTGYTQTVTGVLNEEIGGYAAGTQYGQMIVTGPVTLAGSLNILLINSFTPKVGDTFTVIKNQTGSPITGTFTGLPEGATVLGNGYLFQISYVGGTGHDVTLTAVKVGSTTALTSSVNPSVLNQGVTLTATVSPAVAGAQTPTGGVDFFDSTNNTDLGTVTLSGGVAKITASTQAVGNHVIQARYSGDATFLPSTGSLTQSVQYNFSGFAAPLNQGLSFVAGRTVPIKFQLTDFNKNFITSLSAVTALQVIYPDSSTHAISGLRYDSTANQFIANWSTKGLAAGSYSISLSLLDGTTDKVPLTITTGHGSAGLTTNAAGGTSAAPGGLLGGDITLYVDNTNGYLAADELARIQDAVTAADAVTAPYGVAVTEVTDPTLADVTLNMDTTSAVGGYADSVLGCTTDAGQITIINGWNFYAGSDATQIGSAQYDFETVVTHELGHALGLGHSTDSTSVMYATLNTGTVNRTLTTADLNVADSDTTGACGLHVVGYDSDRVLQTGHDWNRAPQDDGRDLLFAFAGTAADGLPAAAASETRAERSGGVGDPRQALAGPVDAVFAGANQSPIFAVRLQGGADDLTFDVENLDDYVPADFSWQKS
jgi:hypothetical protein